MTLLTLQLHDITNMIYDMTITNITINNGWFANITIGFSVSPVLLSVYPVSIYVKPY